MPQLGKGLLVLGLALAATGALLAWSPGLFAWVGRLPGDVRVGRVTILAGTSLVVSLVLTLLLNVHARLLR
jgi:hypothetical protein